MVREASERKRGGRGGLKGKGSDGRREKGGVMVGGETVTGG